MRNDLEISLAAYMRESECEKLHISHPVKTNRAAEAALC
jgi:hypothetical protein